MTRTPWLFLSLSLGVTAVAHADNTLLFSNAGGSSSDFYGTSVSGAGDVNGDGYEDYVVGAFDNIIGNSGYASVYSGKNGSLIWSWSGAVGFGRSVAGIGDVNGDGRDDVAVGGSNIVNVYSGATGTLYWSAILNYGGVFGFSVAGAGDVNNDGFPDVLIGDPYADVNGVLDVGRAWVLSGPNAAILRSLNGNLQVNNHFGWSVSAAGDIDQDGFDDYIIGIPGEIPAFSNVPAGSAWVVSGQTSLVLFAHTGPSGSRFGTSVNGGFDSSQDGWPDYVIGAPRLDSDLSAPGRAYLYSGRTSANIYNWVGQHNGDHFGRSVSFCGNELGGGFPEIVIGSPDEISLGVRGRARVYSALFGWLLETLDGDLGGNEKFGTAVSGVGDLNRDGFGDFIVADSRFDDQLTNQGGVWVHSGIEYDSSWSNYGTGWPGTLGIPSLTLSGEPVICSNVQLQIQNSAGIATSGYLFIGFTQASTVTPLGGTLLVGTPWFILPLSFPSNGLNLPVQIVCDTALLGLHIYLQVLELDSGASQGVSFSRGLEIVHGLE